MLYEDFKDFCLKICVHLIIHLIDIVLFYVCLHKSLLILFSWSCVIWFAQNHVYYLKPIYRQTKKKTSKKQIKSHAQHNGCRIYYKQVDHWMSKCIFSSTNHLPIHPTILRQHKQFSNFLFFFLFNSTMLYM